MPSASSVCLSLLLFLCSSSFVAMENLESTSSSENYPFLVGSYQAGVGSIALWNLDTSSSSNPTQVVQDLDGGNSPSWIVLAQNNTRLYALQELVDGLVIAFDFSEEAPISLNQINSQSSYGNGPAYISLDKTEKWLFVANYADSNNGTIAVLPVNSDGSLGKATYTQNFGYNSWAHEIFVDPSNSFAFLMLKGRDRIAQFIFDSNTGILIPNDPPYVEFPQGSGPRHSAWDPINGDFLYTVSEISSQLFVSSFDKQNGTLRIIQTASTIEQPNPNNTGAEVRIHPNGEWILASNRGENTIVVFHRNSTEQGTVDEQPKYRVSTQGQVPRSIDIHPTGRYVLAANQNSNSLIAFELDEDSGALTPLASAVSSQSTGPAFIGFI